MDYTDGTMKFTVINNKSGGYSRVQYLHSQENLILMDTL